MNRLLLAASALVLALPLAAQTPAASKKILSVDDYATWRTIDNAQLSPDGKWVVYGLRFTNTLPTDAKPMLKLRDVAAGTEIEIADASQASFSPDGKWLTYLVEVPPRRAAPRTGDSAAATPPAATPPGGGGRGGASTVQRRWELRELATGTVQQWRDIQAATFSPTSSHLLLRRRPATTTGAPAANAARGVDAVLHELATGRSLFLGSVGDAAFNKSGAHLAYTVDATVRDGNGLFLVTLAEGRTTALDNDSLRYNQLTWNETGTAMAVLKGREVERMRERANRLLVVPSLNAAPVELNPTTATGFPTGFVLSDRASLDFSDDSRRVFVGIIPQTSAADTARRRSTDSVPEVDVWLTQDERVQSLQMNRADQDRNRTFRQAFDISAARYITLTDSAMRDIELPITGQWAVGRDAKAYVSDYERPTADIYRVNTATGERTKLLTKQQTGAGLGGISPDGRFFLYWRDARWMAIELAMLQTRRLDTGAPSFIDTEFDYPGTRPSYGLAGFSNDGASVIVRARFDLWALPLDSASPARNLTNGVGAKEQIVFRPVRFAPLDSTRLPAARVAREWDLTQPLTLSAYGEWTKKSGFYRLANGALTPIVYEDASFSTPTKARDADRAIFTRQTFAEFPDIRLAGSDLANAQKISDANPQQAEFKWGRRVLFDYTTKRGVKLQGILALPDDYVTGQKLPMLVTFYEKNSQTMHRYPTPSFLTGMGGMPVEAVSRGYATMLPDVHFHTGSSHSDMLDAVEAATRMVIAMGYVDPKRIGVHGHSYGGEGAAFIGTQSKLFAAIGMGAGVSDLFSDFAQSWGWTYQVTGGSGQNAFSYYLNGQGRWGFSPWDNPERYRNESALTHAPKVTAPFLIMHGTADPTVSFTEGMNFYSALRYLKKDAVLLAYPGEGHGLRGLANRKDLTTRYFQFFDHHLRGAPAPKWMTEGVPYLVKDQMREPK